MRGAAQVRVNLLGQLDEISGEARANLETVKKISLDEEAQKLPWNRLLFRELTCAEEVEELRREPAGFLPSGFLIDALLGTGLTRPAENLYAKAIETINYWGRFDFTKVVSVDLPSGLAADKTQPIGPYVHADLTVTFTVVVAE
jgi:NAD(P)H-hydrate epimerase